MCIRDREAVGLEENLLELERCDETTLWDKIEHVWSSRRAGAAKLAEVLPGLTGQLAALGGEITADYERVNLPNPRPLV